MSTSLEDSDLLVARQQPSSFTSRYYSRKEESERCMLMAAGVGLALAGLASRSWAGLLLAAAGGYLAYQSADCAHRWSEPGATLGEPSPGPQPHREDMLDEAGMESFPASDPPAY